MFSLRVLKSALGKYVQRTAKAASKVLNTDLADFLDSSMESERGSDIGGDLLDEIKRLEDEPATSDPANQASANSLKAAIGEKKTKSSELPKPSFMNNISDSDVIDVNVQYRQNIENRNDVAAANSDKLGATSDERVAKTPPTSVRRAITENSQSTRALMEGAEFQTVTTSGLVGIQGVLNELTSKVHKAMIAQCPPMSPGSYQSDD